MAFLCLVFEAGCWHFSSSVVRGVHSFNLLQLAHIGLRARKNSFCNAAEILLGLCFDLWFGVLHKICGTYLCKARACLRKCIYWMADPYNYCMGVFAQMHLLDG